MALQVVHSNQQPVGTFAADPDVEYQPGLIAALRQVGNEIVVTVSDGCTFPPIGIIDEVRTKAFSKPSYNEETIIPGVNDGKNRNKINVTGFLKNPYIIPESFASDVPVLLNDINGTITVTAGTPMNYDQAGKGVFDSTRVICSYSYKVADVPGDDTTVGSGKCTVWIGRGIFATDQYDTTAAYPLNATLFSNPLGKFTTTENGPGIAMVTKPPSTLFSFLEFIWL